MSHYRVAVFSDSPDTWSFEKLLEPFDEANGKYFEFIPISEDTEKHYLDYYTEHPDIAASFEEYLTALGYIIDVKSGMLGYMANPNAKWDWYSLDGGDWMFNLKRGIKYDDDFHGYRKKDYRYTVRGKVENIPYAFLTPDGKWHAPGNVGWFGMSDDTEESMKEYKKEWLAYIDGDDNPYVHFVDCHI